MEVFDRNKMKQDLLNRTKEAPEQARSTFGKSFFKDGIEEQGVIFWKCGAGDHLIDIIPYYAGPNDPNPKIKEGTFTFVLMLWIHNNVGPTNDRYACLSNWKKACPLCEEYRASLDQGDEARSKELRPQQMCIYNIVCYDNDKEVSKGVQVWAVAHWNFQRFLDKLSNRPKHGGWIPYADPDAGRTIFFNREGTKRENTKYIGHSLEARDYVVTDEILTQAWSLDDLIYISTYEEIYEAAFGTAPPPKAAPAAASPGEGRVSGRRILSSSAPAPSQEAPAPVAPAPAAPAPVTEKEKPEAPAVEADKCPTKGRFGIDLDQIDGCASCEIYDNCAREAERLEQQRKAQISTSAPSGRRRTLS